MEHALYSPSSSERWLRCPGSVALCQNIPTDAREEADEGGYLHHMAEVCSRWGIDPVHLMGGEYKFGDKVYEFSYDYAKMLHVGLDWLEEQTYMADKILYETKIKTFYEEFGTADEVIVKGEELTIFDWKFGRYGVRAKDNTQLGLYACGHLQELGRQGVNINRVTLAIAQPRIDTEVEVEVYEDLTWFEELLVEAKEAYESNEIVAGAEQCVFCPARVFCPDYRNYVMELIDFMVSNQNNYQNFSNEDLEKLIVNKKLITDLFKKVEEVALHRMESGVEFEMIDLVEGRLPPAEWTKGEQEIVEFFTKKTTLREEDLYTRNLKTPTQVMEILGKSQPAKVMLVSENSKRGNKSKKIVPSFGKGKRITPVAEMFNEF